MAGGFFAIEPLVKPMDYLALAEKHMYEFPTTVGWLKTAEMYSVMVLKTVKGNIKVLAGPRSL